MENAVRSMDVAWPSQESIIARIPSSCLRYSIMFCAEGCSVCLTVGRFCWNSSAVHHAFCKDLVCLCTAQVRNAVRLTSTLAEALLAEMLRTVLLTTGTGAAT